MVAKGAAVALLSSMTTCRHLPLFSLTRRAWLLLTTLGFLPMTLLAADKTNTECYELRIYHAAPGKLDALHARFRHHTVKLFAKHGITSVGYWTPLDNPDRQLIFLLSYPSREARETAWKAFMSDPEWLAVVKESEKNGPLVEKVENRFLVLTDFSPTVKPEAPATPRVYEWRTYTAEAGRLPHLLARFRNHTVSLFSKHGMKHFGYWTLADKEAEADRTLTYLLLHDSVEAQATSFQAFRADPEWIRVRTASEEAAGGSLTVPDGVKSVLLTPTDYSPAQ